MTRYVVRDGKVVPEAEARAKDPQPRKSPRFENPYAQVRPDVNFVSRSRPRAKKDPVTGEWRKPPGVEHVNAVGQPVFTSKRQVDEHCAASSDNDYETVSYGNE